jgi:quercetin dioxygenase-like cupin family protein
MRRTLLLLAATGMLALVAFAAITMASPPVGVTPTLLARGTYDEFAVRSVPGSPVQFKAKAKRPVDFVVRKHDYAVGGHTGWHGHPGPVFITVTQGALTYYEHGDPTCTPTVVTAGHGFLDNGHGHMVRNESGQPAQDISVIIAPVGGVFRTELPAPNPFCGF